MQCVILAGGLGTRIFPLTENIPKAMIPINGIPFIDYQLKYLSKQNITKVLLCIGHLGKIIKDYVGDGSQYNLLVKYIDEGENLSGTAGALKQALIQNKLEEDYFVMYGDSFLPIDFQSVKLHYDITNKPLMTILKNNNQWDKSNVALLRDGILYHKNASTHNFAYVDYGLSILNIRSIENIPDKYCLSELFHELSINYQLDGYEVFGRFYEIGSFSGIKDFEQFVKEHDDYFRS